MLTGCAVRHLKPIELKLQILVLESHVTARQIESLFFWLEGCRKSVGGNKLQVIVDLVCLSHKAVMSSIAASQPRQVTTQLFHSRNRLVSSTCASSPGEEIGRWTYGKRGCGRTSYATLDGRKRLPSAPRDVVGQQL